MPIEQTKRKEPLAIIGEEVGVITGGQDQIHNALQIDIAALRDNQDVQRDSMVLEDNGSAYRLALHTDLTDQHLMTLQREETAQARMRKKGLDLKSLVAYKASVRRQMHVLFFDDVPDEVFQGLTTGQAEEVIRVAGERMALRADVDIDA